METASVQAGKLASAEWVGGWGLCATFTTPTAPSSRWGVLFKFSVTENTRRI